MSLYEGAVKRPIMTALVFVAIAILGLFSLTKLPIDLYPDIETNTIMVMTAYPGASAEDIETNLTRPLENALNAVEDLKHMTSQSRENISLITLEFEYGNDIDVLTNDVRDKLDMVESSLPDAAENPIIFKFSTDMMPILILSVQAEESMNALYKILDDAVATPLARVNGVGSVSISGAPKRQIQVYVDPNKMEAYNLTIEAISGIIGAENMNMPGGSFDIGSDTYALRVEGEFTDASQMNNLVVGHFNGQTVYLKDVATIHDSIEERLQEAYNDGVQGAMIVIQKQSGANSVQITDDIKKILPDLQKNLPKDVKLGVIVDTSDNIRNTINSLFETILFAILFVTLVVFIFLGRWRATMIVVITIPLSLIAAFIYLLIADSSLNIISLSALTIAIGMVVDDAIVVLENVTTHIERGSDPKQAAIHGTNEVAISVIASTLTLICVFFPLTMIEGMTGVLFKELGWMVTIIMIVSTTIALTLTPMLCSQMLRLHKRRNKLFLRMYEPVTRGLDAFDRFYGRLLAWATSHRKTMITICVLFFIGSLSLTKFIGSEFMPVSDNSRVTAMLEMPIGTRTELTRELALDINKRWKELFPEITRLNFTVGQADTDNTFASLGTNGSYVANFNIRLCSPDERERGLIEICDLMRKDLAENYPELKKAQVNLGGGGGGMGGQSTVDFEIYGYDFTSSDTIANYLSNQLRGIKGCTEVRISRGEYQPEYQVEFDREKLALYGLNLSTAAMYLRNRINGSTASLYREDGDEYDIRVVYAPEFRTSIADIENILVYNNQGKAVRIKDVGQVVERFNPPTIERKDRSRINTVTAIVSGAPMSEVVAEATKVIDNMDMPAGFSIDLAGSYEDQQESFGDLSMLMVLIILLVYVVMAAQFESLKYPFLIMLSIPFALSGIIIALAATGGTLNMMSMLGGIMLIGIVVKNGIVLIDYISLNRERGMSIRRAVINGGESRLRPVIMTTLTTILGMIPMAVNHGEGSEMWRPMAWAVIGGLTVSTVLTLLLIPTLYCTVAGAEVKGNRKKHHEHLKLKEDLGLK